MASQDLAWRGSLSLKQFLGLVTDRVLRKFATLVLTHKKRVLLKVFKWVQFATRRGVGSSQ